MNNLIIYVCVSVCVVYGRRFVRLGSFALDVQYIRSCPVLALLCGECVSVCKRYACALIACAGGLHTCTHTHTFAIIGNKTKRRVAQSLRAQLKAAAAGFFLLSCVSLSIKQQQSRALECERVSMLVSVCVCERAAGMRMWCVAAAVDDDDDQA